MNKETRIFIWGLILTLINAAAISVKIDDIYRNNWHVDIFSLILIPILLIGLVIGLNKIIKTT